MTDLEPGLRAMAERQHAAGERFVAYCEEHAALTREQARRVLAYYVKEKLVKLDAVSGKFSVQHGALLDVEVLREAAELAS